MYERNYYLFVIDLHYCSFMHRSLQKMESESGKQLSTVDDATESLMSMGPLLPANPEDTTCYWLVD